MNDLGLCLEVVLRSCQPLRHIRHWISRKPLEIEAWFQRTTNRKWPMGKWSRDRWRRVTPKGQTRDSNTLRAQYLENSCKCYLATIANKIVCCVAVAYGRLSYLFYYHCRTFSQVVVEFDWHPITRPQKLLLDSTISQISHIHAEL